MNLGEIATKHFNWIESVGWNNGTVLEKLALVASEVGEAIDECRGSEPTSEFATELADIILRVVAISESYSIDIHYKVLANKFTNKGRPLNFVGKYETVLEKTSVLISAVAKAINECRGSEPTPEFGTKLAIIIIIVLEIARSENIGIMQKILDKMAVNEKRGTRGRVI
ncbi:hypothetical protein KAR91_28430 [Candidatus Pacearchaeota archaeon]|nr:hypothetical protein [Candidatus Pacearchaeota archaeon]